MRTAYAAQALFFIVSVKLLCSSLALPLLNSIYALVFTSKERKPGKSRGKWSVMDICNLYAMLIFRQLKNLSQLSFCSFFFTFSINICCWITLVSQTRKLLLLEEVIFRQIFFLLKSTLINNDVLFLFFYFYDWQSDMNMTLLFFRCPSH